MSSQKNQPLEFLIDLVFCFITDSDSDAYLPELIKRVRLGPHDKAGLDPLELDKTVHPHVKHNDDRVCMEQFGTAWQCEPGKLPKIELTNLVFTGFSNCAPVARPDVLRQSDTAATIRMEVEFGTLPSSVGGKPVVLESDFEYRQACQDPTNEVEDAVGTGTLEIAFTEKLRSPPPSTGTWKGTLTTDGTALTLALCHVDFGFKGPTSKVKVAHGTTYFEQAMEEDMSYVQATAIASMLKELNAKQRLADISSQVTAKINREIQKALGSEQQHRRKDAS